MTELRTPTAERSDLVWPVAVPAEHAVRTVARRLPAGAQLTARLYPHPFLGVMFLCGTGEARRPRWRRASGGPLLAAVVVDLVSGRAFHTDPWVEDDLVTRGAAHEAAAPSIGSPADSSAAPAVRDPRPRITTEEAVEAARALLPGLLARRRRLDPVGAAELTGPPVRFGKPNWWVSGRSEGRTVEVVVDALSGRHYVKSA